MPDWSSAPSHGRDVITDSLYLCRVLGQRSNLPTCRDFFSSPTPLFRVSIVHPGCIGVRVELRKNGDNPFRSDRYEFFYLDRRLRVFYIFAGMKSDSISIKIGRTAGVKLWSADGFLSRVYCRINANEICTFDSIILGIICSCERGKFLEPHLPAK